MVLKVQNVTGVIGLFDFYETSDSFIYVMEKPSTCMDLHDYICKKKFVVENLAHEFFYQILETVIGCYYQGNLLRGIDNKTYRKKGISICLPNFSFQ